MTTDHSTTWQTTTIRSICEPMRVWNPQKELRDEFWYVDVSAVSRDSLSVREPQRVRASEAPSRARKIIQMGDTIFATVRPTLRRIAFVDQRFDDQIASTAFCVVRPNRVKAVPRFLYYLLQADQLNEEIARFESGASYPAVNDKDVLDRTIFLPPKPVQEKIAAVLWRLQRAIEAESALITTSRELKQAALRRLLSRGLREQPQKEFQWGLVPARWDVLPLVNGVRAIDYGMSAPIPKEPPLNGIKIVSTADISKDGRILYNQLRTIDARPAVVQRLQLRAGDVLFNWRNSEELIGKTAIFEDQPEPHIFASFLLRIECDPIRLNNVFLQYLMNYYRESGVFVTLARRAVNQANYNRNEISVLSIPFPPVDEQRDIASVLQTIDRKIWVHERKRASLQELFRTVLNQLMTRKLGVADLDIDTREVHS